MSPRNPTYLFSRPAKDSKIRRLRQVSGFRFLGPSGPLFWKLGIVVAAETKARLPLGERIIQRHTWPLRSRRENGGHAMFAYRLQRRAPV